MTLVPSNPDYGLNALGGALSLEMKNGFTYQGVESEARAKRLWHGSRSLRLTDGIATCLDEDCSPLAKP